MTAKNTNPLTRVEMLRIAAKVWPEETGEPINLGRRWLGMLALKFDDGTWRCLVACHVPGEGYQERTDLCRRALHLSAARTFMHELGRAAFQEELPKNCERVGLNIQGIEILSPA